MFLYAATIAIGAFLLFQVQPLIAKIILPWFGGTAAVWSVCLLFFQFVLLLGYSYAHVLARYPPRLQARIHTGLLLLSMAMLPILPDASWKPAGGEDPVWRILGLLAASVGAPYLLLSTTGPLLQAWYAAEHNGAAPYRLYALSNAGSMLALLTYPLVFEPALAVRQQGLAWSAAYVVFAVLCALVAQRGASRRESLASVRKDETPPPRWREKAVWLALPACASALLLSVSTHLTLNVAPIPFLWVLPLALYLLSFILTFDSQFWYRRNLMLPLFAIGTAAMAYGLSEEFEDATLGGMIAIFAGGLFVACMVCHGELVRRRPHPRYLTQFYLMLSAGGALGGVFVGLIAPYAFNDLYEPRVAVAATALLIASLSLSRKSESWVALGLALALCGYLYEGVTQAQAGSHLLMRNFYGPLKVRYDGEEGERAAVLLHGTINHGEQYLEGDRRRQPTTYFTPSSGVGVAITHARKLGPVRVAVIGLGTGTIAAYGRPGDRYDFYEINPLVRQVAQREFSYLKDSPARVDVTLGDGRLSLERAAPGNFDVLAVDAFSSDSIPVHLLTREAVRIYLRHLRPEGVLSVHVSNRHLDLPPVVLGIAQDLGLHARLIDDEDNPETGAFGSTWVLVHRRAEYFQHADLRRAVPIERSTERVWSDDYSNLFRILK